MVEYKKGYFATSLSGHDKGKLYIIIEGIRENEEKEYVYVTDGRLKPVDHPKKKNIKHIQVIHSCDAAIQNLIQNKEPIRDEDIKCAIKSYYREHRRI